jgi:hypothetical protein
MKLDAVDSVDGSATNLIYDIVEGIVDEELSGVDEAIRGERSIR